MGVQRRGGGEQARGPPRAASSGRRPGRSPGPPAGTVSALAVKRKGKRERMSHLSLLDARPPNGSVPDTRLMLHRKLHIYVELLYDNRMTKREPNWDELRTFREVMRDGSLSGAARRLGVAQPTVGRHIDALEAALGIALFARSPRGLTPTDAALHLAPHVEAMASASAALSRRRGGRGRAGSAASFASPRARSSAAKCCPRCSRVFAGNFPASTVELALDQSQRGSVAPGRRHRGAHGPPDAERAGRAR